jgi:restriction system protein
MPIPDYQTIMLPLLNFAADGQEHSAREAIEGLASHFRLTESERKELLSSGQQTFDNRVGWALTYMKKAGVLEATRRSHFRITVRGQELAASRPKALDSKFLERYPEFAEFRTRRGPSERSGAVRPPPPAVDSETPEDAIESAYLRLRNALATDLLQQIMGCSPSFFERLVVDLLVRMGYGGSRRDAGQAIGKSGDGGIDGII